MASDVGHGYKSGRLPALTKGFMPWFVSGPSVKQIYLTVSGQLHHFAAVTMAMVILLIGPTGSGKTSFVKHATGINVDVTRTLRISH